MRDSWLSIDVMTLPGLRFFKGVKSLRDLFDRIPWNALKIMAILPLMLYLSYPVFLVVHNFFEKMRIYEVTCIINSLFIAFILLWYILCILKIIFDHRSIRDYLKRNPVIIFFGCFNLFIVISTIITHKQKYTLRIGSAGEYFFTYMLYTAGFFVCAALINSSRLKCFVIRFIQIISLIHVVLVYVDYYIVEIQALRLRQTEEDITGIFLNRNFHGYYLTIIILVTAALFVIEKDPKWRVFDGICYLANTYTLMRSNTLGCFIAVFMGLVFLFIMLRIVYRRFNWTVLILIGAFIGLLMLSSLIDDSTLKSFLGMFGDAAKIINNDPNAGRAGSGRWRLWTHTVQYIGERPFFGWGTNGIWERLEAEAGNSRPHNEYLQYAVFFGIPAALCYIAGVVSVFIKGLKRRAELDIYTIAAFAASFGYLVSAFFGNTMSYTAPYFFIMLGFAVRPCRTTNQKTVS